MKAFVHKNSLRRKDNEVLRKVLLGDRPIYLLGEKPKEGKWIHCNKETNEEELYFAKPARKANKDLTLKDLSKGLVIVSTLPNIRSHACSIQIMDLEMEVQKHLPHAKIIHVASDPASGWEEVEKIHPFLNAPGYTLHGVDSKSVLLFKKMFGVGVQGSHRIAHGLFAILEGKVLVSYIPRQQYGSPNIHRFIQKVKNKLKNLE